MTPGESSESDTGPGSAGAVLRDRQQRDADPFGIGRLAGAARDAEVEVERDRILPATAGGREGDVVGDVGAQRVGEAEEVAAWAGAEDLRCRAPAVGQDIRQPDAVPVLIGLAVGRGLDRDVERERVRRVGTVRIAALEEQRVSPGDLRGEQPGVLDRGLTVDHLAERIDQPPAVVARHALGRIETEAHPRGRGEAVHVGLAAELRESAVVAAAGHHLGRRGEVEQAERVVAGEGRRPVDRQRVVARRHVEHRIAGEVDPVRRRQRPARHDRAVRALEGEVDRGEVVEGVEIELRRVREAEGVGIALADLADRGIDPAAQSQRGGLQRQRRDLEAVGGARVVRDSAFDQQRVSAGERHLHAVEVGQPARAEHVLAERIDQPPPNLVLHCQRIEEELLASRGREFVGGRGIRGDQLAGDDGRHRQGRGVGEIAQAEIEEPGRVAVPSIVSV